MQRILREITAVVGLDITLQLVRKWGGREAYIPVKIAHGDPLALVLGLEAAQKLVKAYGGQRLQLPAERAALTDMRNAAILKAIAPVADGGEGLSHEAAGLRYGLTRQQVGNIARDARERQAFAGAAA